MKPGTVECFICVLLFPALVVQAMFFTNSKDNDYPRIGKRILPTYIYKTWYEQNNNLPRSYNSHDRYLKSRYERIVRQDQKPGYYNHEQESHSTDYTPFTETRKADTSDLYKTIWSYIRPEDDFYY